MKTETKSISPESAGLTLAVLSGPRGRVRDKDWPCIEYTCQLSNVRRQVIWAGEYRHGVGHVKWPAEAILALNFNASTRGLTSDEENVCRIRARHQTVKKTPEGMAVEASAAAKLAAIQHVKPNLADVCYSLISDGSAFFDGQRFEDWASELGYDADSRKAEETFRDCDAIGRELARGLSRDELDGLREWASNY